MEGSLGGAQREETTRCLASQGVIFGQKISPNRAMRRLKTIAEVASLNQDIRGESREMDTLMMDQDRLREFHVTLQTELLTKEKRAGRAEFAINGIENTDFGDEADVNPVL